MSRVNWWLDYIEGEVDASTRAEMKSLLRHSRADQDLVKSLTDAKLVLKEHAEEPPDFSESFLDEMHNKIMAQVENTEIKKAPRYRLRPFQKRLVKTTTAGLALALTLMAGIHYLVHQEMNTQWDISKQMAQHASENPEEIANIMAFQSEHDFFVDVATLSLDHLSKEQFESLLKTTKTR